MAISRAVYNSCRLIIVTMPIRRVFAHRWLCIWDRRVSFISAARCSHIWVFFDFLVPISATISLLILLCNTDEAKIRPLILLPICSEIPLVAINVCIRLRDDVEAVSPSLWRGYTVLFFISQGWEKIITFFDVTTAVCRGTGEKVRGSPQLASL